jgi:hypothetical protein
LILHSSPLFAIGPEEICIGSRQVSLEFVPIGVLRLSPTDEGAIKRYQSSFWTLGGRTIKSLNSLAYLAVPLLPEASPAAVLASVDWRMMADAETLAAGLGDARVHLPSELHNQSCDETLLMVYQLQKDSIFSFTASRKLLATSRRGS